MKLQSKNRAFTLIEMLIVVAVIGVLVGIGVPALRDAKERAAIAKAETALAQVELAKARIVTETAPNNDIDPFLEAQIAPYIVHKGQTLTTSLAPLLEGTGRTWDSFGSYTIDLAANDFGTMTPAVVNGL